MTGGPTEPSADLRQMASFLRQTYVALVAEGFTITEALTIIGSIIASGNGGKS